MVSTIAAGLDTAYRVNSSAIVVLERSGKKLRIKRVREWVPSEGPLRPSTVLKEAVTIARNARAKLVCTDYWDIDHVAEALEDTGLELVPFTVKPEEVYQEHAKLRYMLSEGLVDLSCCPPHEAELIPRMIRQFLAVTIKPGDGGVIKVIQPVKSGAHGDIVSAFMHAFYALDFASASGQDGLTSGGERRYARADTDPRESMSMTESEYLDRDPDRD